MKKIKGNTVVWGVIGAGSVCEKKSAPAMNKIPNSRIKSVMRRNYAKAEDYARRHGIENWYDNADHIFNDPEINAVYIATPPDSHLELTIKAAHAGKAVYVEKPMARTHAECLAMIEVCEKAGVPLYVSYYRRALPKFLKIKELIEQKVLGEIRMVNIEIYKPLVTEKISQLENNWRVDPEIAGGGYFYDLASHQLDYLDFLFGPIIHVAGFSTNQAKLYKADDIVTASFAFGQGIMGKGSWCFTVSKVSEKETITIVGSEGQMEFSAFGDSPIFLNTIHSGKVELNYIAPEHIAGPLIQTAVNDLLGTGTCPSTGITGARTNFVMEKMCNEI